MFVHWIYCVYTTQTLKLPLTYTTQKPLKLLLATQHRNIQIITSFSDATEKPLELLVLLTAQYRNDQTTTNNTTLPHSHHRLPACLKRLGYVLTGPRLASDRGAMEKKLMDFYLFISEENSRMGLHPSSNHCPNWLAIGLQKLLAN